MEAELTCGNINWEQLRLVFNVHSLFTKQTHRIQTTISEHKWQSFIHYVMCV